MSLVSTAGQTLNQVLFQKSDFLCVCVCVLCVMSLLILENRLKTTGFMKGLFLLPSWPDQLKQK